MLMKHAETFLNLYVVLFAGSLCRLMCLVQWMSIRFLVTPHVEKTKHKDLDESNIVKTWDSVGCSYLQVLFALWMVFLPGPTDFDPPRIGRNPPGGTALTSTRLGLEVRPPLLIAKLIYIAIYKTGVWV